MSHTALFFPAQLLVGTSFPIEYQLHLKIPGFSIMLKDFSVKMEEIQICQHVKVPDLTVLSFCMAMIASKQVDSERKIVDK